MPFALPIRPLLLLASDATTWLAWYDLAARVVLGSSVVLLVLHFVLDPVLDVWAPRSNCPRVRVFFDNVTKTVQIISVSPQRIREARRDEELSEQSPERKEL